MSAIVPFSISLAEIQGDSANLKEHRQFLPAWQDYGLWVEARNPRDVIRGIRNEAVQKLWAEAFKEGLYCQSSAAKSVDDGMTVDELRKLRGRIEVVCLGPIGLQRLGGGATEARGDAPEVTSIGDFIACASVSGARELRNSGTIPVGRDIEEIWREWFRAAAEIAPVVAIVDRYALLRGARGPKGKTGLERCLEFLRQAAGGKFVEVMLYTCTPVSGPDDPSAEEQLDWARRLVESRAPSDGPLKVFISPMCEGEHARWIRLWRRTFTLDRGVALFEDRRTAKPTRIGVYYHGSYQTAEGQLATLARNEGFVITRCVG